MAEVTPLVRELIESSINLIENEDYYPILKHAYDLNLTTFLAVDQVLEEIDIDTEPVKLQLLGELIVDSVALKRLHPEWDDGSHGWSRLRYILDETGYLGIDFDVIAGYLILNQKEMGLNISPLEIEYSWDGSKDYDLGWFSRRKYDELYG